MGNLSKTEMESCRSQIDERKCVWWPLLAVEVDDDDLEDSEGGKAECWLLTNVEYKVKWVEGLAVDAPNGQQAPQADFQEVSQRASLG